MGWHRNGQNILALTYRDSENRLKSQAYIPPSTPFLVELPMRREWEGFEISREEKTKEKTRPAFESKYQEPLGSTVRNFRDQLLHSLPHFCSVMSQRTLLFNFPPNNGQFMTESPFLKPLLSKPNLSHLCPRSPNIVTKSRDHARQCVKTSLANVF